MVKYHNKRVMLVSKERLPLLIPLIWVNTCFGWIPLWSVFYKVINHFKVFIRNSFFLFVLLLFFSLPVSVYDYLTKSWFRLWQIFVTKNIEMLASHIIVIRASQKTTWNKQQHLYKIGLSYICGDTRKGQKKKLWFSWQCNSLWSEQLLKS